MLSELISSLINFSEQILKNRVVLKKKMRTIVSRAELR